MGTARLARHAQGPEHTFRESPIARVPLQPVLPMSDVPAPPPPPDESGGTLLSDAELRALATRARTDGDAQLRRLVTDYLTLRRVTADVIAYLEGREGGSAVAGVPLLLRARQLADAPRR